MTSVDVSAVGFSFLRGEMGWLDLALKGLLFYIFSPFVVGALVSF